VPINSPKGGAAAAGAAAPGQLRRGGQPPSDGSSSDSDGGGYGRGGGGGGSYGSSSAGGLCSVQSCLAAFVEPEVLDGEERYSCAKCKASQPANKQLRIYHYPRVLVLALKRFASDSAGLGGIASRLFGSRYGSARKNSTAVQLEVERLDLSPYCNPRGLQQSAQRHQAWPVYELVAVSNHSGSLYGGHYTASARLPGSSSWFGFDDTRVSKEAAPGGASSAAYVLFYRLRELAD
jgi:ubiquitin C-terminal hydrolase